MGSEGYGELAHVLNVTGGNELHLEHCDLNKEKFATLLKEYEDQGNLKVRYFQRNGDSYLPTYCEPEASSLDIVWNL